MGRNQVPGQRFAATLVLPLRPVGFRRLLRSCSFRLYFSYATARMVFAAPAEANEASMASPPDPYALWAKYEEIAMHFNTLILSFRLQAVAGLAAVSTLTAVGVEKIPDPASRYRAVRNAASALLVIWSGLACMDLFYYRRLLLGTVFQLKALELAMGNGVRLSTAIEEQVGWFGNLMPYLFHSIVSFALLATGVAAHLMTRQGSPENFVEDTVITGLPSVASVSRKCLAPPQVPDGR